MTSYGKLHCAWNPRYWRFRFSTAHDTRTLFFIVGPFHGWLELKGPELYNGELKANSRRALVDRETFDAYKAVREALEE